MFSIERALRNDSCATGGLKVTNQVGRAPKAKGQPNRSNITTHAEYLFVNDWIIGIVHLESPAQPHFSFSKPHPLSKTARKPSSAFLVIGRGRLLPWSCQLPSPCVKYYNWAQTQLVADTSSPCAYTVFKLPPFDQPCDFFFLPPSQAPSLGAGGVT